VDSTSYPLTCRYPRPVVSPPAPTLAEAVEQWLRVKMAGRGLSPHTVRAYRADVATFGAHLRGVSPPDRGVASRVALSELSPAKVTAALSAIQAAGAAEKTRSRLHGTLTGLFAYLIAQGLLEQDPLIAAGVERPKVGKRLPRYVDKPAEFAQVIAAAATEDPGARDPWPQRDLALAGLLAGTAARAGEVCALTVGDLVLGGEEPYVRVLGKGRVTRDCPLSPELVGALQTYLTTREARTGTPARKADAVFLNTRLAPLSTAALDHAVRGWFARAAVPMPRGAAAHAFRHTVAMQLIGLGESATVVQDLLGHASLSSTQVYTKAAGRHVRAAANALPVRQLLHPVSDR